MSSFLKNSLIALGLLTTAALGYYLFVIKNDSVIVTTDNLVNAQAEIETQEFLRRLNELKVIELSDEIFKDQRFTTLQNNSQAVQSVPIGRTNPFAPTF